MSADHPEWELAQFVASLRLQDVPIAVQHRAQDLMLDWLGSALAGKQARPVETIARFAALMGPTNGASEVLINRSRTSPLFAAAVNAAASHFAEQDDVHNGSVFHPATVVIPVALAVAQALGRTGAEFLAAVIAGYEVGIRAGEFLGRSHYKVFHTTGTAGALAAAATAARLLNSSPEQLLAALGSAGTQAAGLWEFLRDAADSKQLHTAHAAMAGLMAAYLARDGFTGASRILVGAQGMAAGMSQDADASRLVDRLGRRWALAETSFKFHASCRHTHPAADALHQVMTQQKLQPSDISAVTAMVHQGALDVLGPVIAPKTVHQSKFSMSTVLGLIAVRGSASLADFDAYFTDPRVVAFGRKVSMRLDEEVDQAYPAKWIGKVLVETVDGRRIAARVEEPKGDPGNTLTRPELEEKAIRLALYRKGATVTEMQKAIRFIWALDTAPKIPSFFAVAECSAC